MKIAGNSQAVAVEVRSCSSCQQAAVVVVVVAVVAERYSR